MKSKGGKSGAKANAKTTDKAIKAAAAETTDKVIKEAAETTDKVIKEAAAEKTDKAIKEAAAEKTDKAIKAAAAETADKVVKAASVETTTKAVKAPATETKLAAATEVKKSSKSEDNIKATEIPKAKEPETKAAVNDIKVIKETAPTVKPSVKAEAVPAAKEKPNKAYAIKTDDTAHMYATVNEAYNFGTDDFTVETMVKTKLPGTMLARKGEPAGPYNGGFLFICTDDGELKFVTDDGEGYYEVISDPTSIMDDKWHHVLAVRENGELSIYLDFAKLDVIVQANRQTPLNVDNGYSFTVALTDQYREQFDHMEGQLTDIRVWNIAKTYKNTTEYNKTLLKGNEKGLVGWWNFIDKDGHDASSIGNDLIASGKIEYIEKK